MDAGTTHPTESWFIRLGENAVRSTVIALVLTGQMLPAGAVSAQEGPLPPTVASPDQLAPSPLPEASIPPAAQTQPTAPPPAPPEVAPPPEGTCQIGDWAMIIRPGFVPAKPAPLALDPCALAVAPQYSVSVPVTVNVNNHATPSPYQFPWMWSVPATYPTQWNAPTSAYLFQRPRPYWKLRGDFHHLAPFIPGYWY